MSKEANDSVGAVLSKILLAVILMAAAVFIANITSGQLSPERAPSISLDEHFGSD
jgi:hypothetical protein